MCSQNLPCAGHASAIFTLVSCSEDDNDDLAPPVQNISVRIDQFKFVATSISSPEGDELEIYGSLNSKLIRDNITEENMLLSATADEWLGVGTGDVPVSGGFTYEIAPEQSTFNKLCQI